MKHYDIASLIWMEHDSNYLFETDEELEFWVSIYAINVIVHIIKKVRGSSPH